MAEFLKQELIWTRKPERVFMDETKVEIITECSTDGVNVKQMRICHVGGCRGDHLWHLCVQPGKFFF